MRVHTEVVSQDTKKKKQQATYGGESGGGVGGYSTKSCGDLQEEVLECKVVIALSNEEKEEDFMAIKGIKLPQKPKKRSKRIQRTLNAMSPGIWLCDFTLDRYEVKKNYKKQMRRGLKAMGAKMSGSE